MSAKIAEADAKVHSLAMSVAVRKRTHISMVWFLSELSFFFFFLACRQLETLW